MKLNRFQILIALAMMICLKFNNCKRIANSSRLQMNSTSIMTGGLLLTTMDKIILVYPKEFGYEKDFKQVIYKISNLSPKDDIYIRDSIYDRRSYSIYSLICSNSGSQIIRLAYLGQPNHKQQPIENNNQKEEYDVQIASNWSKSVIYQNSSKLSSFDINVKKRRLYWFETQNGEGSFVIKNLKNILKPPSFYSFNNDMLYYTKRFITIAYDDGNNTNDIVFFASNTVSLIICFLVNRTCQNYFSSPFFNSSIIKEEESIQSKPNDLSEFSLNEIEPLDKEKESYKFGILLNVNYNKNDHSLLLSDIGRSQIKRVTFANKTTNSSNLNYTFMKMETIMKPSLDQGFLPTAGLIYRGNLFWAQNHGVKSNVLNNQWGRFIFPIRKPMNLRRF